VRSVNKTLRIKAAKPDTAIIGAHVTVACVGAYPAIMAGVRKGEFYGELGHTAIVPSSLGAKPSRLGAAAVSYRKFFATTTS
jgi:hypothetical protein